jgi:bifunctional non-homologous end joining protein LigD
VASVTLEVDGRAVAISSPDRPVFPAAGLTKLDVVRYHLDVAAVLMPHCVDRPCNLERFPDGVEGPSFVQKRVPATRPDWLRTVPVTFSSGRRAEELCPASIADVLWAVNLGAFTVHPWSVRVSAEDGAVTPDSTPDELRVDLDPPPDGGFDAVRAVTGVVREVMDECGLVGFPKTSGSRGIHVIVRIEPRPYLEVRAAAVALAREVERRAPRLATASWWKEERGGRVFLDYNQNLWDRSMACAYAVRATPDARVSMPFAWDDLDGIEPGDATVRTVPALLAEHGDPMAGIEDAARPLDGLLALAAADAAAGLGDLPMPPHYPKLAGEPPRVAPSRAAGRRRGGEDPDG